MTMTRPYLIPRTWIMRTADGWYPIQPCDLCKPEDHGRLNPHVLQIEEIGGKVLWVRPEVTP